MSIDYAFTEDELIVDESLGFPKAYAKLCRDRSGGVLYNHGPPFGFTPYSLQPIEAARAKELDHVFRVNDPKAKSTAKTNIFVSLLWKQLGHLGNAGFDPTVIRIDPYGNVLYYHADSASPLAWDIDHWFPCSRGGLTVPSNLRIIQRRVCKKKHNKLEFLVPWWDLQLGISVNQFLNIFASSNSDFRHRAFSFLFAEGENEELNASQTVDSHSFPQHFIEAKEQIGLAAAAIVPSRRHFHGASSALKSLDYNRSLRPLSPAIVPSKVRPSFSKENENPHSNPYQAIVMARDSLKQREELVKTHAEIQKLDDEVNGLRQKNEEERLAIQDLELALIKRKRRAEKCRRLAESQCSYRIMLEKMIRDAMHQSVVYKEQVRLNQGAINALMARLEAQKAMSDTSENELHRKYRQRDELEKQIRPEWDQARKRSRMDDTLYEERENRRNVLCLPEGKPRTSIHKELRLFLEEEQKASEAGLSPTEHQHKDEIEEIEGHGKALIALEKDKSIEDKFRMLEITETGLHNIRFPDYERPLEDDDNEERRKERGKGHVEKWLQMLLDTTYEPGPLCEDNIKVRDELIREVYLKFPNGKVKSKFSEVEDEVDKNQAYANKQRIAREIDVEKIKDEISETKTGKGPEEKGTAGETGMKNSKTPEENGVYVEAGTSTGTPVGKPGTKKHVKQPKLTRSDSFRVFRRIPSSPSMILGLKKGVDCMGKKPAVTDDDEVDGYVGILKSSIKTIKRAVKN